MINSIVDSFEKELNDTDPKEINSNYLADTRLNIICKNIKKEISSITGSGITPTNNEIKDIKKVISPLENTEIFLKWTAKKITSQEGEFLNFIRPLMLIGLPLMRNVPTPLSKRDLGLPLGLTAAAPAREVFESERPSDLVT